MHNSKNRWGNFVASIACLGMLASPVPAGKPTSTVLDVALSADGTLVGQVVSAAGQAKADTRVTLMDRQQAIAATRTDRQGRFRLRPERTGAYEVVINDRVIPVRAWPADIAPPAARPGLLCVADSAVRGQFATGGHPVLQHMIEHPWLWGLGIAAAITIPIAIDDDDDDHGSTAITGGEAEPPEAS